MGAAKSVSTGVYVPPAAGSTRPLALPGAAEQRDVQLVSDRASPNESNAAAERLTTFENGFPWPRDPTLGRPRILVVSAAA
jgi:hypothetical protein